MHRKQETRHPFRHRFFVDSSKAFECTPVGWYRVIPNAFRPRHTHKWLGRYIISRRYISACYLSRISCCPQNWEGRTFNYEPLCLRVIYCKAWVVRSNYILHNTHTCMLISLAPKVTDLKPFRGRLEHIKHPYYHPKCWFANPLTKLELLCLETGCQPNLCHNKDVTFARLMLGDSIKHQWNCL